MTSKTAKCLHLMSRTTIDRRIYETLIAQAEANTVNVTTVLIVTSETPIHFHSRILNVTDYITKVVTHLIIVLSSMNFKRCFEDIV